MDQNFVVTSNNGHEMEGKLPGRYRFDFMLNVATQDSI